MALIFMDGFDHYAIGDTTLKYTGTVNTTGGSMVTGLLGSGQALRAANNAFTITRILSTTYGPTIIFGARVRNSNPSSSVQFIALKDGSGNTVGALGISATGQLVWNKGLNTAVVSSAAGLITTNAINFIEVKVTLSTTTTGSVDIHLNGASVASASSVITATTSAVVGQITLLCNSLAPTIDFDDFYLFDSTGSQNNDFAGEVKITTVVPNGNGRVNQWTRTGGTASGNYTAVDETTPDGDTSYVSSSTAGQIDAYTLSSAGSPSAVKCVQIVTDARKDDATTRTIAHGVGNGTTENFDAGTNVGTSYGYLIRSLDTNPLTSAAWATGDLTTLQSAIKCIA